MPDTTPTTELRAAAALLREAASHATPGPWRTHDTWVDQGGHTATVLTDRPDINETELVAWLPTMSNQPWDEARNAWRNAGWMALMGPGVGLALADWLDAAAGCLSGPDTVSSHALAVARQVLGTTDQQPDTAPTDRTTEAAYPYSDGDTTVLGPELFALADRSAIAWEGEWYRKCAPADDALHAVCDAIEADYRGQRGDIAVGALAAVMRIRARAVLPVPVDRAAVLTEGADFVRRLLITRPGITTAGVEAELRRMADEAQQPETADDWSVPDARPGTTDYTRQQPAADQPDTETEASPTAVLLAARCDRCQHVLNNHLRYGACLHDGCTCRRYDPAP